jgi:uncharacterized protein YndB with AHSA1/START domain
MGAGSDERSTRIRRVIDAPRPLVYRTMLDPALLARWKVPDGMSLEAHEFEPREGGRIRISLTYRDIAGAGKSRLHTDTYHGTFMRLIPDELIVERDEFETDDPAFAGAMTITITLKDVDGGTELVATHVGLPSGVSPADNETGWNMSLDKLEALVAEVKRE